MDQEAPKLYNSRSMRTESTCIVVASRFFTLLLYRSSDRFNAGRVCRRWHTIAGDSRMRLRVDGDPDREDGQTGSVNSTLPPVEHRDMQSLLDGTPYSTLVMAVQAAR